jgi:predicted transcriptional regulator
MHMNAKEFDSCARRLKALADPDRLETMTLLRNGALKVSEIAAALGQEISNTSHHLSVLRGSNIVRATKKGRFVIYSLDPDVCITTDSGNQNLQINFGWCVINFDESLRVGVAKWSP